MGDRQARIRTTKMEGGAPPPPIMVQTTLPMMPRPCANPPPPEVFSSRQAAGALFGHAGNAWCLYPTLIADVCLTATDCHCLTNVVKHDVLFSVSDTVCILRLNQVWHREYRCTYAQLWSALPLVCICLFLN